MNIDYLPQDGRLSFDVDLANNIHKKIVNLSILKHLDDWIFKRRHIQDVRQLLSKFVLDKNINKSAKMGKRFSPFNAQLLLLSQFLFWVWVYYV